jgi:ankyrin repeat protein
VAGKLGEIFEKFYQDLLEDSQTDIEEATADLLRLQSRRLVIVSQTIDLILSKPQIGSIDADKFIRAAKGQSNMLENQLRSNQALYYPGDPDNSQKIVQSILEYRSSLENPAESNKRSYTLTSENYESQEETEALDERFLRVHEEKALYSATHQGRLNLVKYLLDNGADIDGKDSQGDTALHIASKDGNLDMVKLLCSYEADSDARNPVWETPICYAARNGHKEILKLLLDYGSDPNEPIIHIVTQNGDNDCLKLLIEHGARIEGSNGQDKPLHIAAKTGNVEAMKILLKAGADIEAKNASGHTAFSIAADRRDKGALTLLLDPQNQKVRKSQNPKEFRGNRFYPNRSFSKRASLEEENRKAVRSHILQMDRFISEGEPFELLLQRVKSV